MKTFLKKFFLFLVIFIAVDSAAQFLLRSIYEDVLTGSPSGGVVNGALASKAEIFILGSSAAQHHYDPRIIAHALGTTVYNAGSDGMSYDYAYGLMLLKAKQHTPKLWVLNLDSNKLLSDKRTAWRLAPRLNEDSRVRKLVFDTLQPPIEKYRYASQLMRFNHILAPLVKERFFPKKNFFGFEPLKGYLPENKEKASFQQIEIEIKTTPIDMLHNIVAAARKSGGEIIFTIGPQYYFGYSSFRKTPEHEKKLYEIHADIAKELNVILLDHTASGIPDFFHRKFFRDRLHLNKAGSKIISVQLAQDLRLLIDSKKIKVDSRT